MEKISSILPKSPRTQNVDHSKAQPARPGAPLLGRPMGRVTQKVVFEDTPAEIHSTKAVLPDLSFAEKFSVTPMADKVSLSDGNSTETKLAGYNRRGEMHKVKIADDVSRNFAKLDLSTELEASPLNEEAIIRDIDATTIAAS